MKKFVVFMLSCILVFVSLLNISSVGASGDVIDKDTVASLIKGGFRLFQQVNYSSYDKMAPAKIFIAQDGAEVKCRPAPDILKYYDEWQDMANKVFTKELEQTVLTGGCLINDNGMAYIIERYSSHKAYTLNYDFESSYNINSNGDGRATATVKVLNIYLMTPDVKPQSDPVVTLTVEFVKTDGGWRICGGTFISVLFEQEEISPDTGDNSTQIYCILFINATAWAVAWAAFLVIRNSKKGIKSDA